MIKGAREHHEYDDGIVVTKPNGRVIPCILRTISTGVTVAVGHFTSMPRKLYKVTANNYGWDSARTLYFETKEEAQAAYEKHPAADRVQYVGRFSDARVAELTRSEDDMWLCA